MLFTRRTSIGRAPRRRYFRERYSTSISTLSLFSRLFLLNDCLAEYTIYFESWNNSNGRRLSTIEDANLLKIPFFSYKKHPRGVHLRLWRSLTGSKSKQIRGRFIHLYFTGNYYKMDKSKFVILRVKNEFGYDNVFWNIKYRWMIFFNVSYIFPYPRSFFNLTKYRQNRKRTSQRCSLLDELERPASPSRQYK